MARKRKGDSAVNLYQELKEHFSVKKGGPLMNSLKIKVMQINGGSIPSYQTAGSSGFDLHANQDAVIPPGRWELVNTGLAVEIPEGYEIQIRSRSGLVLKEGIFVLNSPGTVDSDYRGEIGVILANFGKEPYTVHTGDRIAQGVVAPIIRAEFEITPSLNDTERGGGGFGHTG